MIDGVLCTSEVPKASINVLNEFCNFDSVFSWNKTSGGSNASILNNVGGRRSYFGLGCVSLNFTGTSEVSFNAGGSQMSRVIQRTGTYILSYCFDKSDPTSDITFTVEMYVNEVLQPENTIVQNLYNTSGFAEGQYNRYFQTVYLEYGDVIDFSFKAQSDTTSCYLYFDGLMLQIDDRGAGIPTIYAPAPLDVIEEENTITVGTLANNASIVVTASLTGAKSDNYVAMRYPNELNTLGLIVGVPVVSSDNTVKFMIHNKSGGSVTPTADGIYNFKVIR